MKMFLMGVNKNIFRLIISNKTINLAKVDNQLKIWVLVLSSLVKPYCPLCFTEIRTKKMSESFDINQVEFFWLSGS
jgi:hypothetical protein